MAKEAGALTPSRREGPQGEASVRERLKSGGKPKVLVAVAAASFLIPMGLTHASGSGGPSEHPTAHEAHESHPNHLALFLGASTPTKEGSATSFTIGADYERRLSETWGVGGIVDFAIGDFKRTALLGGSLFVHPLGNLRLLAAPGVEFVEKERKGTPGESTIHEAHFAFRLGVAYEFHIDRFSIVPVFNADLIGETKTTLVYGVAFGVGF